MLRRRGWRGRGGGGPVYLLFWLVLFEYNSFEHFPNLVPRVPRPFGEQVGARRDSGDFEKKN